MKLKLPEWFGGLTRREALRDPLVQTWGLVGGLLIIAIAGHYVRGGFGSERKNHPALAGWWSPGDVASHVWRPGIHFYPEAVPDPAPPAITDGEQLRAMAAKAAGRSDWKFLPDDLRVAIAAKTRDVERIHVAWSGTSGGNATALDWYHTSTLGLIGGTPYDFIIGNGHRGMDGLIETTNRWRIAGDELQTITICLIGESDGEKPTPAQEAALGELIACIEARSGHVTLAAHLQKAPGLLARAD